MTVELFAYACITDHTIPVVHGTLQHQSQSDSISLLDHAHHMSTDESESLAPTEANVEGEKMVCV